MTSPDGYAEWAAAGLTNSSGSGLIGPAFGQTLWSLHVPSRVDLDDGLLRFSYDRSEDGAAGAGKPDGAPDEFVTLPDDRDETFAWFAGRWGALGRCSCGWPAGHPANDKVAERRIRDHRCDRPGPVSAGRAATASSS